MVRYVFRNRTLLPFRFVGLISYSAYLWHQPVLAFARTRDVVLDAPATLALVLLSLVLGAVSWRFVEQPFRRRDRVGRSAVVVMTVAGSMLLLLAGATGATAPELQRSLRHAIASPQERYNMTLIESTERTPLYERMYDDGVCRFWNTALDAEFSARFNACFERHGPATVVLGDSHGMNLYNALARQGGTAPFLIGIGQLGCRPHDTAPHCTMYRRLDAFVAADPSRIRRVLFHQSGSYLIGDEDGQVDSDLAFIDDAKWDFDPENIEQIIAYLDRLGETVDVIWIGPFAEFRDKFRDGRLQSQRFNPNSVAIFGVLEQWIDKRLARQIDLAFDYIEIHSALLPLYDKVVFGDCLTVSDKDHWSECGEDLVGRALMERHPSLLSAPPGERIRRRRARAPVTCAGSRRRCYSG